jgi:hypothetical protein
MADKKLADDATYRAGLLVGRQQAVSEVVGLVSNLGHGTAEAKVSAVLEWCVQTLEGDQDEARLMAHSLRNEGR